MRLLPLPILLWLVDAFVETFHPPDEFKQPYYVVSRGSLQGEGDSLPVAIGGEVHDCYFPTNVEKSPSLTVLNKDSPAFKEGWKALQTLNGTCGLFQDEYWAWRYCHQSDIVQFEPSYDEKGAVWLSPKRLHFVVGRDSDESPATVEPLVHNDKNIIQVHMKGGDICDLTNEPRDVKIYYACHESSDVPIFRKVDEPFACTYEIYMFTNLLCDIPEFRKPKKVPNYIHCRPRNKTSIMLSEEEVQAGRNYAQEPVEFAGKYVVEVEQEIPEEAYTDEQINGNIYEDTDAKPQQLEESVAAENDDVQYRGPDHDHDQFSNSHVEEDDSKGSETEENPHGSEQYGSHDWKTNEIDSSGDYDDWRDEWYEVDSEEIESGGERINDRGDETENNRNERITDDHHGYEYPAHEDL